MLARRLAPGGRAAPVPQVFQIRSEIEPERPLQPGEFTWSPGEAKGELVVVADLKTQMVHVYRGGEEIGVSTISTGRKGFETPTGFFRILEKKAAPYSYLYDLAPIPLMHRLTVDGIALHAAKVHGRLASHGCIRSPGAFGQIM